MKLQSKQERLFVFIAIFCLAFLYCGSSNRLREYEFRNLTAAALMATPPRAQIFSDSFVWVDTDDPIGSALRIGTTIAKDVEARKVRERLENALHSIDVPEQIRLRTLKECSKSLHYRPTEATDEADYLFRMKIRRYGIEANSWSTSVHFKIDLRVQLIDNQKDVEIWEKRVNERFVVSQSMFGLGDMAGNVITAVALSRLTEEELTEGFRHLADYTADRMAEKLHEDFINARSNK